MVYGSLGFASEQPLPTGFTEVELFRCLIPDYDVRLAKSRKFAGRQDAFLTAEVSETLEANFGWPNKKYLIAAVFGGVGLCGGCHFLYIGVFDERSHKLVWHWDGDGLGGFPELKTLRIRRKPAFSFEYSEYITGGQGSMTTCEDADA